MAIEKDRLKQLLVQYVSGNINRQEINELLDYISLMTNDRDVNEFMQGLLEKMELQHDDSINVEGLYKRIAEHPKFIEKINKPRKRNLYRISGVAAILLLSSITFLFLWYLPNSRALKGSSRSLVISDIQPSNSDIGATLHLADGTVINLDESLSGLVATQGNTRVVLRGSELHFEGGEVNEGESVAMNTIVTPKGRQYKLVLSDGTRIWLNAASTLVFPARFNTDRRVVDIKGEAYFEVERAEDWPFIVKASEQQIEVLGTHFNVSAYDDDRMTKTTLVEGKLQVSLHDVAAGSANEYKSASQRVTLSSGYQAITFDGNSLIKVEQKDTEEVISWKQNLFVFNNEEIEEVMRKVGRWYDIEVDYRDGMEGRRIGGTIQRFEDIEKLMNALKATGLLNYKMEGGKIIIME